MNDPREQYFHALKRILRYIWGTLYHGLHIHPSFTMSLTTYFDVDWGDALLHIVPLIAIAFISVAT